MCWTFSILRSWFKYMAHVNSTFRHFLNVPFKFAKYIFNLLNWNNFLCVFTTSSVMFLLRYSMKGNIHGISRSRSLPRLSPIPPATRRMPEPTSRSLPLPFDPVWPGNKRNYRLNLKALYLPKTMLIWIFRSFKFTKQTQNHWQESSDSNSE